MHAFYLFNFLIKFDLQKLKALTFRRHQFQMIILEEKMKPGGRDLGMALAATELTSGEQLWSLAAKGHGRPAQPCLRHTGGLAEGTAWA